MAGTSGAGDGGPKACPEFFAGPFVGQAGSVVASSEVTACRLVGVLFAASWCVPSRQFVSILEEAYTEIRKEHGSQALEMVLVPREKVQNDWREFHASMPWLSVPWGDPLINRLKAHFKIERLPHLVILDKSGSVVSAKARGGSGFGFCCDPLHAFASLMRASGQELPSAQRSSTKPKGDSDDEGSDADSDDDDDD
mmetsp:Transcript_85680/g.223294  ORF Transcript_85680/g.223294 Transcript_85680/m.223294 type:complete len:196 (-) Transcript_85680:244-831(-)